MLAPQLEADESGYQQDYFSQICALEEGSFWFRARNKLLQWAVKKYLPAAKSFLEVGCGTGFVLGGLHTQFSAMRLTGSELSSRGLAIAAVRLPDTEFLQMDARSIPFTSHFDGIGAFDVIEHIQEDGEVLSELHKALRPGGKLFLTVPQHPALWSKVDVFARHVRRYSRSELTRKVESAGFKIIRTTSFVSLLLPLLITSRLARPHRSHEGATEPELALPRWINQLLGVVMNLECRLIRMGMSFPVGGSLLVVAQRPEVRT